MTTTTKGNGTRDRTGAETELRAAARRCGLTMRSLRRNWVSQRATYRC